MSRRPGVLPLLVASAVMSAGCAGPDNPLQVEFKEVPSNVILGAQSTPAPLPVAPPPTNDLPFVLPPPSVVALPPPPFEVAQPEQPLALPSLPPAPTCGKSDPLQAPAVEAPPAISAPPAAGQYLFRTDGSFEVSGADARQGRFPPVSLRTVSGGAFEDESGFFFNVTETVGDVTTKTDYEVVTSQPLGSPFAPGIYVFRITNRSSSGQERVFTPSPSLPLATFPLTRGAKVEARGVDPTTATAMSFTSTVAGKARVDACGEPLDSWTLELTQGRVLSPDTDLEFSATYALGTQYGGLVLRDTVAFAGVERGAGVSRSLTSTISQEPKLPAGPQP